MPDVSARELVQQIWDDVAAELAMRPEPEARLGDYEKLLEDHERHYINSRYVLDRALRVDSGDCGKSSGIKGRLRGRAARFVLDVLGHYFDDEQEFLVHLVRLQNRLTVAIDNLGEEVRLVEGFVRSESVRLRSADAAMKGRLEDRLRALEEEVAALRESFRGIEQ